MVKEKTKNMTKGNPTKLIISFVIPLLIGNLFQQLYSVVDTIIVGKYIGVNALAAVGSTSSIVFLIGGFVMGLTQGLSILVAQYYGAEDYNNIKKSITMSTCLYLLVGIAITVVSVIYSRDILLLLNTPAAIIDEADTYMKIIFMGIFATVSLNSISGILRALGDSKNPLYALLISSVINIVLDIFFIVVFKTGVEGAAYATVISQFFAALFCFYKMCNIKAIKIHKKDWQFDKRMFVTAFKLGIPVALMNSVTAVGVMVLQFVVNGYGEIYVAAYSAGSKIVVILELISLTFGSAIATYSGQNLGAGRIDRIKMGMRSTNIILFLINICAGLSVVVFGRQMLGLFVDKSEVEVINAGYDFLIITSIFVWILGLLWLYRSTLQAIGDTFIPMISGVLEFLSRIGAAAILPNIMGFRGIALSEVCAWTAATVILVITYYYRIAKLDKKSDDKIFIAI